MSGTVRQINIAETGVIIWLQISAAYVPFLQRAVPLGWTEWGIIIVMALPIFILTEPYKWYRWNKTPRHDDIKR